MSEGSSADPDGRVVGVDVLDCSGHEEAVELASRHPMARFGRVELRPVWPLDG